MNPTVPRSLRRGDTIRVVAPSTSAAGMLDDAHREIRDKRFAELGLTLTYGEHVAEKDDFGSSSVTSRVADLHAAFADPDVAGILTVLGGYNANQMLPYLDWDLIGANPKVLCGYSDITALLNSILHRTGLMTYLGPHWCTFGMRDGFEPIRRGFVQCVFEKAEFDLAPAAEWSDDGWYRNQDDRTFIRNEGWWVLQEGSGSGRLVGGNLCTFNLLQGTPYMPSLADSVLVVEDDFESHPYAFDRDLTSLLQQPDADRIQAVVIGRFQRASNMTRSLLEQIVASKGELKGIPVIANVDIGHTFPFATVPIGGQAQVETDRIHVLER
jgi:muramoyltetrapeptide carboxypeptidase